MITGFNPADMYARRSHPARAAHVSRRLLRDRRVHHPQGVRLVEGRRRDRQPDQSGARPHPRLRRAKRAWSSSCTTTSTCRSRRSMPSRSYLTQMKALLKRHPKTTIIWAHTGLGRVVRPVQVSAEAAERSPTTSRSSRACSPTRRSVTSASTSRGTKSRSTRSRHRRRRARGRDSSIAPRSVPVRHRHRRAGRAGSPTTRSSTVGAGVEAADPGREPEGSEGQLRAALQRGASAGTRMGEGERRGGRR